MLVQESQAKIQSSKKNSTVESQWIGCTVLVAVSGWWPAGVNVLLMFTVTKIRRVSVRVASCWKVLRFHTMSLPSSPMLHKVWSCTWTWNDQLLSTSMGRGIDQPWPSATYQYGVLWVEADTQHISTVSLQSRHLKFRHTGTGDGGRFFPQLKRWSSSTIQRELCCFLLKASLGKHIKHILNICIGKKTCTNT